jgi:hypothetical protein
VKLVPADLESKIGTVPTVTEVLQVTLNRVPSDSLRVTKISLLAVTAVSLTTQVAADAVAEQEKAPAGAAVQATKEGDAAVPTAAQFVEVPN